ncbi:hypothetical protein M438DRAFT_75627 [Aureobasidium pullulans EXF-150]|uniref:Uncharacterized protein n=1 Tax=Aureobasidium pullulans EXF-150 TaxID=1043002 RepID=A0A074X850_AURPU|nr:uncharacterized protein M438DRAFT_75627 [Aureobasidium pullulans EXF-150]KEQ81563.1 hypothetical protein M438DRAFT_75627 [Aureobasidium pullulans EXF-150]
MLSLGRTGDVKIILRGDDFLLKVRGNDNEMIAPFDQSMNPIKQTRYLFSREGFLLAFGG